MHVKGTANHGMRRARSGEGFITVEWYTTELQVRNTFMVHHQCSQSPETNALDLGVWM